MSGTEPGGAGAPAAWRGFPAPRRRDINTLKACAELGELPAVAGRAKVTWSGDPLGDVMLVKGSPGPGDVKAGKAMAGPDGEAAAKALDALGLGGLSVFALCCRAEGLHLPPEQLRSCVEAVDPLVVVALDGDAAADVAASLGLPGLAAGEPVHIRGRVALALDGLEASLADPARKARVWKQFQTLAEIADSLVGRCGAVS